MPDRTGRATLVLGIHRIPDECPRDRRCGHSTVPRKTELIGPVSSRAASPHSRTQFPTREQNSRRLTPETPSDLTEFCPYSTAFWFFASGPLFGVQITPGPQLTPQSRLAF